MNPGAPVGSAPHVDGLVSVVLPTFNRADVIVRSVRSVLAQTHRNLELIVVDDGSTDETLTLLGAIEDDRMSVVSSGGQLGPSGARNVGIDLAAGRYLAFQDSDDEWMPDKLSTQLDALEASRPRAGAAGCRWDTRGGETASDSSRPPSRFEALAVLFGIAQGTGTPMLVLDRQVTDSTTRFDPAYLAFEERDFLYRALRGACVVVVERPLAVVERGRTDHVANARRALAGYERFIEDHPDELAAAPCALRWYHHRAMREALRMGDRVAASRHRRHLRGISWPATRAEWALGWLAGDKGLRIASRLGLSPRWRGRAQCVTSHRHARARIAAEPPGASARGSARGGALP